MNRKTVIIVVAIVAIALLVLLLVPRLSDSTPDDGDRGTAQSRDVPANADQSPAVDDDRDTAEDASGEGETVPAIAEQLAETARQINADAPTRIDRLTILAGAQQEGNRIRYRYEFAENLSAAEIARLQPRSAAATRETLCGQPEIRAMISGGGVFEYRYFGPGGEFLFATPITSC